MCDLEIRLQSFYVFVECADDFNSFVCGVNNMNKFHVFRTNVLFVFEHSLFNPTYKDSALAYKLDLWALENDTLLDKGVITGNF